MSDSFRVRVEPLAFEAVSELAPEDTEGTEDGEGAEDGGNPKILTSASSSASSVPLRYF